MGRDRIDQHTLVAAAIALFAGAAVLFVSSTVFAYHSSNHDEAVYLTQAAMLLNGQLEIHAGELAGSFRPWFFIEDGGRLYSKYTPVPAAMFAVTLALFGEPRVTLAVVAAANAGLVYLLGSMCFDRRVGIAAAAVFAASPLAIVNTSTFLPYAPTTALNLAFAVAYLRAVRDRSLRAAVVAGIAIGLAFFARPYTAVLFAAPFILHACYEIVQSVRADGLVQSIRVDGRSSVTDNGSPPDRAPLTEPIRRQAVIAALGSAFVLLTLAYNLRLTGAALTFPYEAFAPMDGPGFGRRRILGHSIDYTPELALEANGYVLWYFGTRWFTAGAIGTAAAGVGLTIAVRRWLRGRVDDPDLGRTDMSSFKRTAGVLVAGLFVSVPLGNLFFWGNFNILATMSDPTDGLISGLGPFYHFDLLVPLSTFAAVATVAGYDGLRRLRTALTQRTNRRAATALVAAVAIGALAIAGGANVAAVADPIEKNSANADKFERAYAPIEETDFENAIVFIPTPYGDWQHHPFQYLRHDPSLEGDVVYPLDRDPDDDFAVIDAYPNRTHYRYAYKGEWVPDPNRHVVPKLEPIDVRSGDRLDAETRVGVPGSAEVTTARVRLETHDGHVTNTVTNPGKTIAFEWTIDPDEAFLNAVGSDETVAIDETDTVIVTTTLVQPDGSTLTYRQETTVRTDGETVEAIWPPERSVCPLVTDCGSEGTYLPNEPDAHRDGVFFETTLEKTEE
ncbi:ArnT family glycosyltransferase [Halalkalirubrum salinum]|uniref:ArnT family glycosyltransferase n=1 Tax=Halalkalirubrum salinum TaxID=2563889 RepID=UPI0010FB5872|nr:glycosyltransferase family 39 protein [Halalkalirubrum salinum]